MKNKDATYRAVGYVERKKYNALIKVLAKKGTDFSKWLRAVMDQEVTAAKTND